MTEQPDLTVPHNRPEEGTQGAGVPGQHPLAEPLKEMLKAIGGVHNEVSKLDPEDHYFLCKAVQVCFEKFQKLDEACASHSTASPDAHQAGQHPLLDIRHRPNGDVVIDRFPEGNYVFNRDEWQELSEYCAAAGIAATQAKGRNEVLTKIREILHSPDQPSKLERIQDFVESNTKKEEQK